MGSSIAWSSVSCDYGVIFSFSMILTLHVSLRAVFYSFYNVIFRDGIVSGTKVELS